MSAAISSAFACKTKIPGSISKAFQVFRHAIDRYLDARNTGVE
jgi:hydroxymethylpyrimidine/phosphomethylpyrimidine kinase